MNKYCLNLMYRTKNYKRYLYCKHKRCIIEQNDCNRCIYRETKNVEKKTIKIENKLKNKKYINKFSKHHISVSKKTYDIVFNRDNGCCRLCGTPYSIQLHHIIYRSESKALINEPTNCIMLCLQCHNLVHSNKNKYQPILKDIIKKN